MTDLMLAAAHLGIDFDGSDSYAHALLAGKHLPGQHDQSTHGHGGATSSGAGALDAPKQDLARMTAAGDPRAESLWYRTGDNSLETTDGQPGFVRMNEHLRHGPGFDRDEMDKRVADIDSVMKESKLPRAISVHRGIDEGGFEVGTEFKDKAFVSVSADPDYAREFGTVLNIHVPAGTPAIRLADRDPNLPESEILLDRGLTFRVIGEREGEIDVEVLP